MSERASLGRPRCPAELIPGLLAVGAFAGLAIAEGGYPTTSWAPAGLFLVLLTALTVYAFRRRLSEVGIAARVALVCFTLFTAWCFASIGWAAVPGDAWDGANRSLVYLVVYALFVIVPWRPKAVVALLAAYALVLSCVGAATIAGADAGEASHWLIGGRLAEPAGYPNAVAALFIGGFWPAVWIASRREVSSALRVVMLPVAGLLLQVALLTQSRGALFVFPLAALAYVALTPNRVRAVIWAGLAIGATVIVSSPILEVYEVAGAKGGDVGPAIGDAGMAMLVAAPCLFVVGAALVAADRFWSPSDRLRRGVNVVAAGFAALALIGGIVAGLNATGDPVSWAGDRWQDFKGDYDPQGFGDSRFSGDLGSGRYDFWRVGLDEEFAGAPLVGTGADNFASGYLKVRETGEEPLFPHSLPVRILAGTGLIGAVLFLGFVVAACAAALRTRIRGADPMQRGLAAVALASAAYLGLHSAGDWLWSFTAVTAPVIAWLAMAGRLRRDPGRDPNERPAGPGRKWGAGAIARLAVAVPITGFAVLSLALPWLAARDVVIAADSWRQHPDAAQERLDRARDFNFLSADPDLTAAAIATQRGERKRAGAAFTRALEREPDNWYALLGAGTASALAGDRQSARERFDRAAELNPRDELIAQARRRADRGRPLTFAAINEELLHRVCARVGTTNETRYCEASEGMRSR